MTLLNTDLKQEMNQFAAFLHSVAAYKRTLGSDMQLLIEPKPKEPTAHQYSSSLPTHTTTRYDYDAMTVVGFLHLVFIFLLKFTILSVARPSKRLQAEYRAQPYHPGRSLVRARHCNFLGYWNAWKY